MEATSLVLSELRSRGEFGPAALKLLMRLFSEELQRFPVLRADRGMSEEDYALEFFADRGKALTAQLVISAMSEESVGKIIRQWVRNWLVNANEKTAMGALRDRVEKRLRRDARFEMCSPEHFWKLKQGPDDAASVDVDALKRVANKVFVTFFVVKSDSVKRVQLGKVGELEHLLEELFHAAGGSLHISAIIQVLAHRFPHVLDPQRVEPSCSADGQDNDQVSSVPSDLLSPAEEFDESEAKLVRGQLAAAIAKSLSATERKLLLALDDPPTAAAILGCGRSSAYVRLRELRVKLLDMAGNEPQARTVLAEVLSLCGAHDAASLDGDGFVLSDSEGGMNT